CAAVQAARRDGGPPPVYPVAEVRPHLHDTWRRDTGTFFAAWLGTVIGGGP
ncbi:MAG: hypothetical protein IH621_09255, partial [Krumholzibacteria bacterium]|nr:hypothetical protein [Candidatus Krumholzibacteria bacterium]